MTARSREDIAMLLREKLQRWHPFDAEDDVAIIVRMLDEEHLLLTDEAMKRAATEMVRAGVF